MATLLDLDADPHAEQDVHVADSDAGGSTLDGAADPVDAAFELIREHIGGLEPRPALRRIRRYQDRLSAM